MRPKAAARLEQAQGIGVGGLTVGGRGGAAHAPPPSLALALAAAATASNAGGSGGGGGGGGGGGSRRSISARPSHSGFIGLGGGAAGGAGQTRVGGRIRRSRPSQSSAATAASGGPTAVSVLAEPLALGGVGI